jgi:hypothetical protein
LNYANNLIEKIIKNNYFFAIGYIHRYKQSPIPFKKSAIIDNGIGLKKNKKVFF